MSTAAEGALADFRRTRRRHYVESLDVMEVLYRVYVGAIGAAIGLGVLAGLLHEAPADADAVAAISAHAPAIIGVAVALGVLAGLRSGARGGPLAIEPAEVQYTLLAPVDRGAALRPAARAQLRTVVIAGAILGAVVGNFVFRRFPGSPVEWLAGLALFGAIVPAAVLGAATLACGRRLRPWAAGVIGVALVAWSVADLVFGLTTAPGTMLGELATLPLQDGARVALAGGGALLALAVLAVGLLGVGGLLLEAARRRAALAAELRFSASVRDVRTVILLRRQLASERPRRRPWLRLRGTGGRRAVGRRGWQSFLRWPVVRIARVLVLAAAAGACAVAAWHDSIVLSVIPGVLLLIAALDVIEPLAQEADHPTRTEGLPLPAALLFRQHLLAPGVVMAVLIVVAGAAGSAVSGSGIGLELGLVLAVPSALVIACCAAISATNDPYAHMLQPQIAYAIQGAPVAGAAIILALPLLLARAAWLNGDSPLAGALPVEFFALGLGAILVALLGVRMDGRRGVKA
jgi:hypothetical protein